MRGLQYRFSSLISRSFAKVALIFSVRVDTITMTFPIKIKLFSRPVRHTRLPRLLLPIVAAVIPLTHVSAQPINDSLKAVNLRNEQMYRKLNAMDDKGASYAFTNVTAWHITDDDLKNQIINIYTAKYGTKQLKNFDIDNVYLFVAPAGTDQSGNPRFEPFHVLFMGKHVNVDTSGEEGGGIFGGGRARNNNQTVPVAFKGKDVIVLMRQQPGLDDQINATQGESVELPGDILPRGVQLVKNSDERYIFHQMFTGFYSKTAIINEQDRALGLPTLDEQVVIDTTQLQIPTEPDENTALLSDEALNSRAFRFEKSFDLSIDHLGVNLSRTNQLEVQLGNPEVGLPFWSSGEGMLDLNMRNQIGSESDFKIGVNFPVNLGREDNLVFNARRLSGFWGGTVDAYFAGIDFFSAFNMPIAFNFTVIPAGGYNSSIIYSGIPGTSTNGLTVPGSETFFRTSFIGQLYIPIILQLDPANFVQLSAGVGVHTVKLSFIPGSDTEAERYGYASGQGGKSQDLLYFGGTNASTPFTPHVGIQYVNHRANKFGLNFQYDHLFTFGAWLELIPDHLRIEGSYTAPLVRDAKPYEPPYFFEITPHLYF